MTQTQALNILQTGVNVFLTGEPGSGKTYVVNQYVQYLRAHRLGVAVTASTGIAATHIGGMTIHSWSGIGIRKELTDKDLRSLLSKQKLVNRAKNTDVLIIDEISMLDAQVLNTVNAALQALLGNSSPFGGLQVVLVGDFFQLPPVSREGEVMNFAFVSPAWQAAKPVVCYLTDQYRQTDEHYAWLLNSVRSGINLGEVYTRLLTRKITINPEANHTRLFSHNADVDRLNAEKLKKLPEKERQFQMSTKGRTNLVEQLKKGCLSPETLVLKKGARVMFTKNNYEAGFVNGTLGEVVGFKDDLPVVATNDGQRMTVSPMEWTIEDQDQVLAGITQIPLRLAWAITVHKSQGMTLDAAVIDLSSAFEYGQGYVAISRVRSFSGLWLVGINQRALEVHPEVILADAGYRSASDQTLGYLHRYSADEMKAKHENFIRRCGGSLEPIKSEKSAPKKSTYEETLELCKSGKDVVEISKVRGLKSGTILAHLEKLRGNKQLTIQELQRIIPANLNGKLTKIHQAFDEFGDGRLGPVFEKFGGTCDYDDLRLARLMWRGSYP